MVKSGEKAEHKVVQRLEEALSGDGYRIYANVEWTGPTSERGPARDGEADVVVTHADHGLLVIETKSGQPSRSNSGTWSIGSLVLKKSPFEQAATSKRFLVEKLRDLPDWPSAIDPMRGHAVAFPDVDLASLPAGHALLGVDSPTELVLDATILDTDEGIRSWIGTAFGYWIGDGRSHRRPLGTQGVERVDELLRPVVSLHRLVKGRIEDDREELIRASREQALILNRHRSMRRVEVAGPAGSGKSMLAVEKARKLAAEGYRTLFVCFNQRLATHLQHDLQDATSPGGLEVTTFHRLCELKGSAAGVLPARPNPIPREWWDGTLPETLDAAIDAQPDDRYHAVIVDEGQDFAIGWLESLGLLLRDQDQGVFWVFHDPAQALFRPDVVADLGLERLELFEDHRNPPAVAALAKRFRSDGADIISLRQDGLPADIVEATPGDETVDALRRSLHRLIVEEKVATFRIAVLSGVGAIRSDVWKQRKYGNTLLWNEALDDDGGSKGLPPERVPEEPDDVVLFETIRRFKGLERDVIVLVELPEADARLDQLLYVGLTRATTHVVVIAPHTIAERLR
jgi:hypothetical protein